MKKTIWYYVKDYRFKSLLFRNFICVVVGVVMPLLLTVFNNYKQFDGEMKYRMQLMNEEILHRSASVVDNIMESVFDILEQISDRSEIWCVAETKDESGENDIAQEVIQLMREYINGNSYVKNISIYSETNELLINQNHVLNIESAEKEKWYYVYKKLEMNKSYVLVNNENSIYVCKQFWGDEGKRVGVLAIEVELQKIRNILDREDVSQDGLFFVKDVSGQVLYCNQVDYYSFDTSTKKEYADIIGRTKLNETVFQKDNKIVSVMPSSYESWNYAVVSTVNMYEDEVGRSKNFIYGALTLGLCTSIIIACFITYITYRPVKKIIDVIEKPQQFVEKKENDEQAREILYITSSILNSMQSKKDMGEELEKRTSALQYAQSRALQFQMNPHFLYNTLETIKWCTIEDMGIGNRTAKSITKLAGLYRFCLNDSSVILTLREELEFTRSFIEVLQIRFGDKINFEWEIDESLYQCKVIKMCIQPLVENSINHGLKGKFYNGTIGIYVFKDSEGLHLEVEDNGVGLTSGEIMQTNHSLQNRTVSPKNNVGLRNINERIKLVYGDAYGIVIKRTEKYEQGIKACITLPYFEGMKEDEDSV